MFSARTAYTALLPTADVTPQFPNGGCQFVKISTTDFLIESSAPFIACSPEEGAFGMVEYIHAPMTPTKMIEDIPIRVFLKPARIAVFIVVKALDQHC